MAERIANHGKLAGLCGHNGTGWQKAKIDPNDRLEVTVKESALPEGAALQGGLDEISDRIGDDSEPATGTVNAHLDELIALLEALPLPAGAATSAKQLPDGHNVTVDNVSIVVLSGTDKIFGFESIAEEAKANTNLSAGYNALDGTAIPTGKIWMITQASLKYTGTVPTNIRIRIRGLASGMNLLWQTAPVSDQWYMWSGEVYLQEGDQFASEVEGATAGDALRLRYAGVQMNTPG